MSQKTVASEVKPIATALIDPESSIRLEFWDGSTIGDEDAKAVAVFRSPEALRHIIWAPGELGIARAYITGEIDLQGDVFYALTELTRNDIDLGAIGTRGVVDAFRAAKSWGVLSKRPMIPSEELKQHGRAHTKLRDKKAISHHYDVGNDFYELFLGDTMTYSCARFTEPGMSLDAAQEAKYDLVCRKLGLEPGMRLLDVGCGWGGMVMHAVKNYGVTAVGITLSEQQMLRAQERIEEAGLSDKIEIRIQDYRDVNETFDAISSIGMFEHVGHDHMTEYFKTLYAALRPGGRLLNHAISKPHGSIMSPKGFIARYVFPDGELQDVAVSTSAMEEAGFEARDVESLREHYATTLRHWVSNLESNWAEAIRMVGTNRARVWWMYMAGSAVAFETNRIAIHQTLGVKTHKDGRSEMPPTRASYV